MARCTLQRQHTLPKSFIHDSCQVQEPMDDDGIVVRPIEPVSVHLIDIFCVQNHARTNHIAKHNKTFAHMVGPSQWFSPRGPKDCDTSTWLAHILRTNILSAIGNRAYLMGETGLDIVYRIHI